jgi:hypothetical protein
VLRFLKSKDFFDQWDILISRKAFVDGTTHYAEVDEEERCIIINPYKEFIHFPASVVHEVLHILHPRSREKTILRWEHEVMTDISPSEITALLTRVFSNIIWDE